MMPLYRFDRNCFQEKVKYNCLEEGSNIPPCVGCREFTLLSDTNKIKCKLVNTDKCTMFAIWEENLPKWAGISKFKKALKKSFLTK